MVDAIALETIRVGVTARKAAHDPRAGASALYLTDREYRFFKASCGDAADVVRTMEYVGALQSLHLADALP